MNEPLTFAQQLMLPQLALGGVETAFNALIVRSPHCLPILRKLAGKSLKIQLTQPDLAAIVIFSEHRTDWLNHYADEVDCQITLQPNALPKLTDKSQLTALINHKQLILNGDIQVLQHFTTLLDSLEKDPAELLSPFVGDVLAQLSTNIAKGITNKIRQQFQQHQSQLVENLLNERPVLVHRLEAADFYDQVAELAQQADRLAQKFTQRGL